MDQNTKTAYERIQAAYAAVHDYHKHTLTGAIDWAHEKLFEAQDTSDNENYELQVIAAPEQNLLACTISKPSWAGDHCGGRGMPTGSEAIVMAVCEYLNGA